MNRKYFILFLCLFLVCSCDNQEEIVKSEYVDMKKVLIDQKEYTDRKDLPLDIMVYVDRVDEETVNYRVVFSNAKENMKDIKAMVIHNYYNENLFPSVGVFDDRRELLVSSMDSIELKGSMQTTKNISRLHLELKVLIEYINDLGEKKEVFYKTT